MSLRANQWWAIVDPEGYFLRSTMETTRQYTIHEWLSTRGVDARDEKRAWARDRKMGYRCVKCEIVRAKR